MKKMERQIMELVEESCLQAGRGVKKAALDKAKEASSKERSLIRLQENSGLSEAHNLDLTFAVSRSVQLNLDKNKRLSLCVCNLCTLSFVIVLLFDSTATNIALNTVRNSSGI
jgi:hypothetical protein